MIRHRFLAMTFGAVHRMGHFRHEQPEYFQQINISQYQQQFAQDNATCVLVDVREVDEFAEGHIPGAVNIPLTDLADRYQELPVDEAVVLVCSSGVRSEMGALFLNEVGFTNLYNLAGGIIDWMNRGLPLEI